MADNEDMIDFFESEYSKKAPTKTSANDSTKYVVTKKKIGLEMLFSHEIINKEYPIVELRKNSYRPYFSTIIVNKESQSSDFYPKDIDRFISKFGDATFINIRGDKIWIIPFNSNLEAVFKSKSGIMNDGFVIRLKEFLMISSKSKSLGLFIHFCLIKNLLHKILLEKHKELVEKIKSNKANALELVDLLPRKEFWSEHLIEDELLRRKIWSYFRRLNEFEVDWIKTDLISIFGKIKGEHGHNVPNIEIDSIKYYKKAEGIFSDRIL